VPVVTVSGHHDVKGVTNIVLNHQRAAELALKHLFHLGHRKIAFIKGQEFSSDTEERWANIERVARRIGLTIDARLVAQLEGDSPSPQLGYMATKVLLASRQEFTALFAFNDISAMGSIRALHESGCHVPEDVSVVGFDDIQSAAFQNPALTTVRQPLREMGRAAAEILLKRINRPAPNSATSTPWNPNSSYEKPQAPPPRNGQALPNPNLSQTIVFHTNLRLSIFQKRLEAPECGLGIRLVFAPERLNSALL